MTWKTASRLTILSVNHVLTTTHTWSNASSFTMQTGFGFEMLDDDDATTQLKTASISGTPELRIDFGVAKNISAFGICNHNLRSANVEQIDLSRSSNGSTWTVIDPSSYILPLPDPVAGTTADPNRDIAIIFNPENFRYFRMQFLSGGAITNFNIGYVYWGTHYIFNRNVLDGGFIQSRNSTTRYIQSAGGMSHAIKGMTYRPATLEMNFGRATSADMDVLNGSNRTEFIIGVIPPEQAPASNLAPIGQDVFWGRVQSIDQAVMTPTNITLGPGAYNATVTMVGAV